MLMLDRSNSSKCGIQNIDAERDRLLKRKRTSFDGSSRVAAPCGRRRRRRRRVKRHTTREAPDDPQTNRNTCGNGLYSKLFFSTPPSPAAQHPGSHPAQHRRDCYCSSHRPWPITRRSPRTVEGGRAGQRSKMRRWASGARARPRREPLHAASGKARRGDTADGHGERHTLRSTPYKPISQCASP